jgi:hypothetical protein
MSLKGPGQGTQPLALAGLGTVTEVLFLHDIREQAGIRGLLPVFGMTVAKRQGARDFGS